MINYTYLKFIFDIYGSIYIYHETITTIKISKILFGLLWMPPFCPFILPFHSIHREKLRAVEEEGNRGWDDWMASLTQWTCYINGLVHNVYEWLFKQNTAILRLIHVIRYINSFFILLLLYILFYIYSTSCLSIHLFTHFFYISGIIILPKIIAKFYFAAMNTCKTTMNIYNM